MKNIINTYDHDGKNIICSSQTWYSHIVNNHSIMYSNKNAVEETISDPDTVYQSSDYTERKVFFKTSTSASYSPKLKTKVIVEYNSTNSGEVVTAFPVKDEKGGISNVIYSK